MIYFTFNIYLVEITGNEPAIMASVLEKVSGAYAVPFWSMIVLGFIAPAVILAFPKGRERAVSDVTARFEHYMPSVASR